MNRRHLCLLAVAALLELTLAPPSRARADALTDIAARGTLRVAVPQDFPPFGSVGADMTPQGYDIDMAKLIAEKLGVKVETRAGHQRQPHPLSPDQQGRPGHLQPRQERRARKGHRFLRAPTRRSSTACSAPADVAVSKAEDLAGKTVGVTRGAIEDLELTKVAPADATIKRYEDNNGTISAFLSGQVEVVATGNVVAAAILAREPAQAAGTEVPDQELALLHRHEQERAGADGQGQRDHRRRQGRRLR